MISKNDQKRLEIFKNRTVVNGNTLAEEQEAKKQIGKILSNYEGDYEYIPDIGYVKIQTQQEPQKPLRKQYVYMSESDFYKDQIKYEEDVRNRSRVTWDDLERINKEREREKKKKEEEENLKKKKDEDDKRKREEEENNYIKCPNCGCLEFYTLEHKVSDTDNIVCKDCLKIIEITPVKKLKYEPDTLSYFKDNIEYIYSSREVKDLDELKLYIRNINYFTILHKDKLIPILKRTPFLKRIFFKLRYFYFIWCS